MSLITFTASRVQFVSITEPVSFNGDNSVYQLSVPVTDLPDEIKDNAPHAAAVAAGSSWGLFTLRSNRRPRVFGVEPESRDLERVRLYCHATGTDLGALLRDKSVEIACTLFEKTRPGSQDPFGLALTAIRVDGNALKLPGWDDLVTGKIPI